MRLSNAVLRALHVLENDVPRRFQGFAGIPVRMLAMGAILVAVVCSNLIALVRWPVIGLSRVFRAGKHAPTRPLPCEASDLPELLSNRDVVVVDFFANECGPCLIMKPIISRLASQHAARLTVAEVDATFQPEVTKRHGITGYPTCILFCEGHEVARLVGSVPYEVLEAFLEENLSARQGYASQTPRGAVCDPITGVCHVPGQDASVNQTRA